MGRMSGLFKSIPIGPVETRNRIAMAPMATGFCSHDGFVTGQNNAYYVARAKGGVGLIIIDNSTVPDRFATGTGTLDLSRAMQIRGINQLGDRFVLLV